MQFSQINKYQSLIQRHLKPSYQHFYSVSHDYEIIQKENIRQVLSDLQEINISRSYSLNHMNQQNKAQKSSKGKSNESSEQTLSFQQSRTFASQLLLRKNNKNKSLIFATRFLQKDKQSQINNQTTIKVYYFNSTTFRHITFSTKTTIIDLINKAIEAYHQDQKLDASILKQRGYQNYEMRLALNNSHKADMNCAPLSYDKIISDSIFQELVLLQKQKTDKGSIRAEPIEFIKSPKKTTIMINLYNELNEELGYLNMNRNDSLEKIFEYIQINDLSTMSNFYLTENMQEDDGLPRDFQIKNLQSNKIYIKAKKYIDQTEFQSKKAKPIRNLTIVKKERESNINLPIGLNEASQYEEFYVIKVNNRGVQQERILGIDQTKIYNYDKNIRQDKKQASFFSKIFGVNQTTGTKKPFRLIEDILTINTTEKGLIINFKEKSITYIIKNPETQQKIYRKLCYLISYVQSEKNNTDKAAKK